MTINSYQRWYDWSEKQWDDLWGDIKNIKTLQRAIHFAGNVVMVLQEPAVAVFRRKDNTEIIIAELVDGQQRITTLIIILHVFWECYDKYIGKDAKKKDWNKGTIRNLVAPKCSKGGSLGDTSKYDDGDTSDEEEPDQDTSLQRRCAITLNSSLNPTLLAILNLPEGVANCFDTLSHKKLQDCPKHFTRLLENYMKEFPQHERPAEFFQLLTIILTKITLAEFKQKDPFEANFMFTIINDRGKSLTELDRLKSMICAESKSQYYLKKVERDGAIKARKKAARKQDPDMHKHLAREKETEAEHSLFSERDVWIQTNCGKVWSLLYRTLQQLGLQNKPKLEESFIRALWMVTKDSLNPNERKKLSEKSYQQSRSFQGADLVLLIHNMEAAIFAFGDLHGTYKRFNTFAKKLPDRHPLSKQHDRWKDLCVWFMRLNRLGVPMNTLLPLVIAGYIRKSRCKLNLWEVRVVLNLP